MSWNPVTGCHNGCDYCYARVNARRFDTHKTDQLVKHEVDGHIAYEATAKCSPYPAGFLPTLYRHRLDEPLTRRKPARIFTVSMGDLWSPGVPTDWVDDVVAVALNAPWHRFYFLTKRPDRLREWRKRTTYDLTGLGSHLWFGVSITGPADRWRLGELAVTDLPHRWLSYEPYQSYLNLRGYREVDRTGGVEWVVLGGLTGRKPAGVPPETLDKIVLDVLDDREADDDVPIWVKTNVHEGALGMNPFMMIRRAEGHLRVYPVKRQARDGLGEGE